MGAPAVEVRDVSKSFRIYSSRSRSIKQMVLRPGRSRYEEFHALSGVSFDVPEGRTFGLLGNNGSGKSTLLKCIARILEPNRGSIVRRGRVAAMLEVGSGFHPELTGRENIYLNGSILGMARHEVDAKFDSIVDFSDLDPTFIDQPVKNYSSGMYVRLGFSVATHVDPDILLVDEVLAVGDIAFQAKCTERFTQLRNEGKTVVVVSHALEQMRTFCDEAVWLDHGTVQAVGEADDVISSYADSNLNTRHLEGGARRFGAGGAEISRLELVHETRGPTSDVKTGDPVRIVVHLDATQRIVKPLFGISIESHEGHLIWSHMTTDSGFHPAELPVGRYAFDVTIPSLPLRPGTYLISGSIHDEDGGRAVDVLQRATPFDVHLGSPRESGGWVVMNSSFGGWREDEPAPAPATE